MKTKPRSKSRRKVTPKQDATETTSPLYELLTRQFNLSQEAAEEQATIEAYEKAYYGDYADSPLFWAVKAIYSPGEQGMRYLKEHDYPASAPSNDYMRDLLDSWKRSQKSGGYPTTMDYIPPSMFYRLVTIAVIRRDAGLFDKIATILRNKLGKAPEDKIDRWLIGACRALKEPRMYPTKRAVRELAVRNWATMKAIQKRGIPWDGIMPSKTAIDAEEDELKIGNLSPAFRRVGLSHLPNDKGGRPRDTEKRRRR